MILGYIIVILNQRLWIENIAKVICPYIRYHNNWNTLYRELGGQEQQKLNHGSLQSEFILVKVRAMFAHWIFKCSLRNPTRMRVVFQCLLCSYTETLDTLDIGYWHMRYWDKLFIVTVLIHNVWSKTAILYTKIIGYCITFAWYQQCHNIIGG